MDTTIALLLTLRLSVEVDLRHAQRELRWRFAWVVAVPCAAAALWNAPIEHPLLLYVRLALLLGLLVRLVWALFDFGAAKNEVDDRLRLRADLRAFSRKAWMHTDTPAELAALRDRVNQSATCGAPMDPALLAKIEQEIADERAVFLPPSSPNP